MTHTLLVLAWVGLALESGTRPLGQLQVEAAERSPAQLQSSFRLTSDVIRRDAEARIRASEKQFARLKTLPPGPVQPLRIAPGGKVVREIILRERIRLEEREEDGPAGPELTVAPECFDQVLYGTTGDASSGREHANTILIREINAIERSRGLTQAQRQKLWLAGQGDIKRLFDSIQDKRKEFELVRRDVDRCEEFLANLLPLRSRIFRGPFEFDSLFIKTFNKIVNEGRHAPRPPAPDQRAQSGP